LELSKRVKRAYVWNATRAGAVWYDQHVVVSRPIVIFDELGTEWNLTINVDVICIVFNARFNLINKKEKIRNDKFETSRERERERARKNIMKRLRTSKSAGVNMNGPAIFTTVLHWMTIPLTATGSLKSHWMYPGS
jgi:hypothetical protein